MQKSGRRNRNSFSGGPDDGLSGAQDAVRKLLDLKTNYQTTSKIGLICFKVRPKKFTSIFKNPLAYLRPPVCDFGRGS